jgi:hypothetical protein
MLGMRWIILALALASAGCQGARQEPSVPPQQEASSPARQAPPSPSPAADPAPAAAPANEWAELASDDGSFTIRMIAGVKPERDKVDTALGRLDTVTWVGERGTRVYYVGFVDYPKGKIVNPKGALDGARDGAVKNVHGKVLGEKPMTVGKWPARDLAVAAESKGIAMGMRVRFVMAGDRLYTLQVLQPGGSAAEIDADATQFFDSLRLK